MLSKTLQDGLNDYGIGAKIRALRLKKKIGLVDLGKHTGLSPALLSKSSADVCSPRCRRYCASRSSLASAWSTSSLARVKAARRGYEEEPTR